MSENYTRVDVISHIIRLLKQHHDVMVESTLKNSLKRSYNEFSQRELNKILMSMETQGLIHVSGDEVNRRTIKLLITNGG